MIWTSGVSLPPTSLMERLSLGSTRLILMLVISPSGIRWYNLGKTKMDQDGIYLRRPPNAQFQPLLFFFLPNFGFSQTKLCIVPHTCFPFSCLRASISFSAWNVFHSRTKPSFFFKACTKWSLPIKLCPDPSFPALSKHPISHKAFSLFLTALNLLWLLLFMPASSIPHWALRSFRT